MEMSIGMEIGGRRKLIIHCVVVSSYLTKHEKKKQINMKKEESSRIMSKKMSVN